MKILRRLALVMTCVSFVAFNSITVFANTAFVGDSRTVGMKEAVEVDKQDLWVAKVGAGFSFYRDVVKDTLYSKKPDRVIFLFGVNDTYNADKYCEAIKELKNNFTDLYVVSVNPVDDKRSKYVKNKDIEKFNKTIKSICDENGIQFIDTYSKCKFNTVDGLHYDKETYVKIYNEINEKVNGRHD